MMVKLDELKVKNKNDHAIYCKKPASIVTNKLSGGAIAGIVIGSVVGLIIIVSIIMALLKRNNK